MTVFTEFISSCHRLGLKLPLGRIILPSLSSHGLRVLSVLLRSVFEVILFRRVVEPLFPLMYVQLSVHVVVDAWKLAELGGTWFGSDKTEKDIYYPGSPADGPIGILKRIIPKGSR